jgi:hypothetical protein
MPFLSGTPPPGPEALGRFLPPVPDGIARAWVGEHIPEGGWVLDPFGSSPRLAAEAASTGRRALVAANNPVTRFLVEMAADPPSQADFQAALAELAVTRKGEERLEQHILSLYETACANCRREISAEAFVWDAHSGIITQRIYTCPYCGDSGERDAAPADVERSARFAAGDAMHRSRALARIAPPDDPDRPNAEEALQLYLPRAVYALGTLINRLDQLTLPPARRRALQALLLHACDLASSLWSHGPERARPRSLQLPGTFLENNVWKALEEAATLWTERAIPVPVTVWPELPLQTGGLCIFEGALRDLVPKLGDLPLDGSPAAAIAGASPVKIAGALGVYPRPNQAFWTLSALWAGWLWGRESAAAFKSVLRRRRYDWQWHAEALRSALGSLKEALSGGAPFFALLAEAEPPFVSAALAATGDAGFALEGVSIRSTLDPLQLLWKAPHPGPSPSGRGVRSEGAGGRRAFDKSVIQAALGRVLAARAEPLAYMPLQLAGTAALLETGALPLTGEVHTEAASAIQQALEDPLFRRFKARTSDESGYWGLAEPGEEFVVFSDRVEIAIVRFLGAHPGCTLDEIDAELYGKFPGLLTPPLALVAAALESYATQEGTLDPALELVPSAGAKPGGWRLREEDAPSSRRAEIAELQKLLLKLGKRLDFHVLRQEGGLVVWEQGLDTALAFFVQASAVTERVLRESKYPAEKTVLVIPGGRAGLLAYKLRRDPYLSERIQGWRFLKFRHLRQLSEAALLSRESWDEQLVSDPIESSSGQMLMF